MSKDLQQRLHEALDAGSLSDELLQEVSGRPELESMIELDAALRAMPRTEFDFSDAVLARLDEPLEEIPGLLDAPHFEDDLGAPPAEAAAVQGDVQSAPISLDDARRKRSGAPFLLAAAAVIGLVATGTLMTLNAPARDQMAMQSSASREAAPSAVTSAAPASPVGALGGSYPPEEAMAEPAMVQAEEATEAEQPEAEADDNLADELNYAALGETFEATTGSRGPAAAPRRSRMARGGALPMRARASPTESEARDESLLELSASQRRTVARIESCLPDHIRITRVRESSDGQRVIGVETSEPLSDQVDGCVSGVLDSFPQARRRARRPAASMSAAMNTATTSTDD